MKFTSEAQLNEARRRVDNSLTEFRLAALQFWVNQIMPIMEQHAIDHNNWLFVNQLNQYKD